MGLVTILRVVAVASVGLLAGIFLGNAIVAELVKNWALPAGAVAFPLLTTY